jgi:AcrR family transcriptional regulator
MGRPAAREQKNATELRREIMDAATELFVSEGYARTSMRKIADKIGYSPTTIYLYFRDKSDLLDQICDETFARLTRNIKAINSLSADPLHRLRLGMEEYIQFGLNHPVHYQILFGMKLPLSERDGQGITEGEKAFNTLREAVTACASAKLLKSNDIELISQTLWTGLHGVTSLLNTHPKFPWVGRQKVIDSVVDTLIAGVTA